MITAIAYVTSVSIDDTNINITFNCGQYNGLVWSESKQTATIESLNSAVVAMGAAELCISETK